MHSTVLSFLFAVILGTAIAHPRPDEAGRPAGVTPNQRFFLPLPNLAGLFSGLFRPFGLGGGLGGGGLFGGGSGLFGGGSGLFGGGYPGGGGYGGGGYPGGGDTAGVGTPEAVMDTEGVSSVDRDGPHDVAPMEEKTIRTQRLFHPNHSFANR
ncbi:uncharacterized protein LOC135211580 [Macrobrachium nipponense]|uniref:uncharacterized protein LOC135211580 n=1 Tax=Macrobrachium nipponense TaxID=159736 RepID=UPI0030C8B579